MFTLIHVILVPREHTFLFTLMSCYTGTKGTHISVYLNSCYTGTKGTHISVYLNSCYTGTKGTHI